MTSPHLFSSFTSFTTTTITYNLYVHTLPRNTSYTCLSPIMFLPISSSISQSHNLRHNFASFFLNYYYISTRHNIDILQSTIFSRSLSPSDFTPSLLYLNLMIPITSAMFQTASSELWPAALVVLQIHNLDFPTGISNKLYPNETPYRLVNLLLLQFLYLSEGVPQSTPVPQTRNLEVIPHLQEALISCIVHLQTTS